jgi:hypothetical protein
MCLCNSVIKLWQNLITSFIGFTFRVEIASALTRLLEGLINEFLEYLFETEELEGY